MKAFKAEIVDLLIGMLFLLLVARLEFQQFLDFFAMGGGWILLAVILIIRPISVLVSSWGTPLTVREKALLSWVAPRGVVAASMASLFALTLQGKENPVGDPALLESFVYSVICATVLIQGLSSGLVAKALHLQRPAPNDWVIIGAHHFGRELARKLAREDVQNVILLDTNTRNIGLAQGDGLKAVSGDGMEAEKLYEEEEGLYSTGYLLALTDNIELNQILMQRWAEQIDSENVFGWIPTQSPTTEDQLTGQSVFGDLSRPVQIGNELLRGDSSFETVTWEEGKTLPSGDWHPLFIRRGKQLRAVARDAALKDAVKPDDEVICLRRSEGFLLRALESGGLVHVDCATIEELYEQLTETAAAEHETLDKTRILEDLTAQGRVFPAFIGHGIAIPHVYCDDLETRICFVAQLKHPLEIPDQKEAIHFVFFLISPRGDTEGHLAALAEIARDCRNTAKRQNLNDAETIDDVIRAVQS